MNINNLERLNNAANANNIQLEQTVRITTNINNGVVRTTDVQYDIIRHAEATIEERPRFPGTPQFARVEPVPVERELETGVQAGDNIINEIINRANEHANTVTTTQDIIPLDGQITFLNTWIERLLLQHPDIVRIEGLENLTGLVNHVRYVDTTRGLTNMMEAGLAQLNQTLLIDRHAELIALIHNAAHFENQARIINFGPIAMQGARINWRLTGLNFEEFGRNIYTIMETFLNTLTLMGHEAITIFMDLMHHNPILTILLLLLRYPNFLPGLIPFHMLRRISLNELVRVINFILQAIQDQLRRFEQRQIRTEIANAGIANTETIAATALNTAAAQNVQIQAQAVAQNTQIQANAANAARNPFIIAFRRTMTFLTSPQGRLLTGVGTLFALANYQGIATGAVGFYEVIRELLPRDLPQIPPGMPRIEGGGTGGGGTGGGGTGIPVPPTEPGGDSTTKELLKNIWKLVKSLINHLSK